MQWYGNVKDSIRTTFNMLENVAFTGLKKKKKTPEKQEIKIDLKINNKDILYKTTKFHN